MLQTIRKMKYTDVKKFTVKRSSWARGRNGITLLLSDISNTRCCLGFYAQACGIPDEKLLNKGTPGMVIESNNIEWDSDLIDTTHQRYSGIDSEITMKLMSINDDNKLTETERESMLTQMFRDRMGVEVEFID
jgi:hypothetical protein